MRIKRYLSFLIVLTLILSSATTVFAVNDRPIIEQEDIQLDTTGPIQFEGEMTAPLYNDNDDVRIIVELSDEPAIAHAQSNGVQYASLPQATKSGLENNLLSQHAAVKNDFSNRGINMAYAHSFTVAFNGFSGVVKGFEIEAIRNNPSVKNVYLANEYERPEPTMISSHDMIGSSAVWGATGFNGEKMVVAIVDTGIDPSHRDLLISEETQIALTEQVVNDIIGDKNLSGKYFTEKVPYGYNYFDLNTEIRDLGDSHHGMHVAGTVAANGDVSNGGIKGVAPEAQLLAMKVFSNNPAYASTYDDIYMKAIEESIELGVDVVNMSLGSTASFYEPESAMDEMITNARENGVVFAISAGNSAHSTNSAAQWHQALEGLPFQSNPDIGLVGAPSLNKDSISVASIENTHSQVNYISYGQGKKAPYSKAGPMDLAGKYDKPVKFVDVGIGEQKDFVGKEVKGKVALISRGVIPFTEKIENAEAAGAIVAIVYNNSGNELINMQYPDNGTIPSAFIGNSYGVELKALEEKTMSFPSGLIASPNPKSGQMSDFTSWGTTPSLELKPEITAPGGQIYSTQNNNSYSMMSGTSMAAPHTAGGSALVLEYIKKNFDLDIKEQSAFAKVLLMNTAVPVKENNAKDPFGDSHSGYYSPRRQGAGLMRLDKAVKTPVTVVNISNGEAKVELKDFTNKTITMNLRATNHSDKKANYEINVSVLADYIGLDYNFLHSEQMDGVVVNGDNTVTLEANQSKDITVTVDLTNARVPGTGEPITENMFVEGFINLVAPTETDEEGLEVEKYPSLVVPYVGFYGDWAGETSPKILDGMERFDEKAYFGQAGMVNQSGTYMGFLPTKGYEGAKDRLAISPGTDSEIQGINAVLSFMRNAEVLEINILDARERLVRKISKQDWVRKTYYNPNNPGVFYSYTGDRLWDGKINNQVAEDGEYIYQIKALPQYEGAEWQITNIPVSVDTKAPQITDLVDQDKKLTWSASDVGTGVAYFEVYLNDKLLEDGTILASAEEAEYEYNYEELKLPTVAKFSVVAYDFAGNNVTAEVGNILNDNTMPTISLESPSQFDVFTKSEVTFEGTVTDDSAVENAQLTIIKEDNTKDIVELELDEEGKFNKELTLEDGLYRINLSAKDIAGNENLGYTISIFVDTTAPIVDDVNTEVVKSNYITDLSAEKASTSNALLGGGKTIIFEEDGQAYAYDRSLLEGEILEKFNAATEKYVKLADGIFVNAHGKLVTRIPAVKYFENTYYANLTMSVEDNFSEFKVYANGDEVYAHDNFSRSKRNDFNGEINFEVDLLPGVTELELVLIDGFGNKSETISIDLEKIDPTDEDVVIEDIRDIRTTILINEDYSLPEELQAHLSDGTRRVLPVQWEDNNGEVKEGEVSFEETGVYTFIGTVDKEHYGGYDQVKLTLTVEGEENIDEELFEEIADKLMEIYEHLTDEEKNDIREVRENLQDFVSNEDSDWDSIIGELLTGEVIARFGTEEEAEIAMKEFVAFVSEVNYTTDRDELVNLLKDFTLEHKETFRTLFGNDIIVSDMFELLIAAKAEALNNITSEDADKLAFGSKEDVINLVIELMIEATIDADKDEKFQNSLVELDWDIRMLVTAVENMSDEVSPEYKAEMALALAIVRSEIEIELLDDIIVGENFSIKLTLMGRDITSFVDWDIEDANLVSEEDDGFEALEEGQTTIRAHRQGNVKHWIAEIGVTILAE